MFSEVATTSPNIKVYKDGNTNHLTGSISPLFYESIPGSGDHDTAIDMTAQLDSSGKSYSIIANGWHFRIWHKKEGSTAVGTIGYGGRRGQHWIYTRVDGIWAFDSSDNNLQPMQAGNLPPTYSESDFYINNETRTFGPLNEQVTSSSTIGWNNVWSGIDIRLKNSGDGLKMEIVVNASARSGIEAKIISLGLNTATTIVGPRLECDFSDIPKVRNGQGSQSWSGAFDDADGLGITLEDGTDNLLAFMPTDVAYVENDINGNRISAKLRSLNPELYTRILTKRLWKSGPNYFILSGLPANDFSIMSDGELVFDPSFQQNVTNANDGDDDGSVWFPNAQSNVIFGFSGQTGGFRFTALAAAGIPQGQTFTVADITVKRDQAGGSIAMSFFGDDADASAAFSSSARPSQRTQTTASVAAGTTQMTTNTVFTFDITAIAEEVIGRGSWTDNLTFVWAVQSGSGEIGIEDSSAAGTDEAVLDLTWPDVGGAVSSLAGSGGLAGLGGIAGIGGGLAG